jgi:hypothetical protein
LSKIDSWANHETRVLEVIVLALEILRDSKRDLTKVNEDNLNFELYFYMLEAVRRLGGEDSGINSPPVYECINQPLEEEELLDVARKKRPDFQWGYINHSEPNPRKSAKHYYIECKRLGTPTRSDWVFNQNYVLHGVLRFVKPEWKYGRASSSGTMIGYIQSMELEAILVEVNGHAAQETLPSITLSEEGWKDGWVTRLEQTLNRQLVPPSPFQLRHMWVDMRSKESQN